MKTTTIGQISAAGLYLLLFAITIIGGVDYAGIIFEIFQLVTGGVSEIKNGDEGLLQIILTIISVVVLTIPIIFGIGVIVYKGKTKGHDRTMIEKIENNGPITLFMIVFSEESLARGLFLGILTKVFTGDIGFFYAMFLVGNALWAYMHIYNFKDKKMRSILLVVPHFIAGIAFTYLYVRYGLFAAIAGHYLYNIVLLTARKKKRPNRGTWIVLLYHIVLLVITFILMTIRDIGISDLMIWISEDVYLLNGYGFWDYTIVLLAIDAIVGVAAGVLLLDTTDGNREAIENIKKSGFVGVIVGVIVLVFANAGLILLLGWILGFITSSIITRSILITIFLALFMKSRSGSSFARVTIVNLPGYFFTIATFLAMGFWPAVGLSSVFFIVHWVPFHMSD